MTTAEQIFSAIATSGAATGLVAWWRERCQSAARLHQFHAETAARKEEALSDRNAAAIARLEKACDRQDDEISQLRDQLDICRNARHEQETKVAVLEMKLDLHERKDAAKTTPQDDRPLLVLT